MKSRRFYILILGIVAALPTNWAKAVSSVKADYMWDRTSDKYNRQVASARYWKHLWNFGWAYPDEKPEEDFNYGLELIRNQGQVPSQTHTGQIARLLLGKKIGPELMVTGALGIHSLNVDQSANSYTTARGSGRLKIQNHFYQKNEISFSYENDFHYYFQLAAGSARTPLTTEAYNIAITLKPHERIRFPASYTSRWVSDGVQRQSTEGSLLYGISPSWPWIWVGLGAEYMSHSRTSPDYYSPEFFKSYGTRAEASFPLNDFWSAGVAWNYSLIQEGTFTQGVGHYFVSNLNYGSRQDFNAGVSYTKILSQQSNSQWESESFNIRCEYPF